MASALQCQSCRQQFRIVQVIYVSIERAGSGKHPARGGQRSTDSPARLADVMNGRAILHRIAQAVSNDQRNLIASCAEAAALFDEYPDVVAWMRRGKMGDMKRHE